MSHLHGIHRFLAETSPTALFLALVFGAIGTIWLCRRIFEGHWYNVTYSGQIGDIALGICVAFVGTYVLRHLDQPLPEWLGSSRAQFVLFVQCAALSVLPLLFDERPLWQQEWAEIIHGFVIVPVLFFLVVTVLLVTIQVRAQGMLRLEVALIVLWAGLVVYDVQTGRDKQPAYHAKTGEYFLFGW